MLISSFCYEEAFIGNKAFNQNHIESDKPKKDKEESENHLTNGPNLQVDSQKIVPLEILPAINNDLEKKLRVSDDDLSIKPSEKGD